MERELWEALCHLGSLVYNRWTPARYGDDVICQVYWWAVVHDRPVRWACDAGNWPASHQKLPLPSQPTMSRRLRTAAVEQLLLDVEASLVALTVVVGRRVLILDAKPLPVGGASQDADAAWGRGAGGISGYKLHAVWGEGPLPVAWGLAPLNVSERRMAQKLISQLPGQGYLLADKHYDVNYLYEAAAQSDYQLLAPQQRPGKGLGHRPHSRHRLQGLALLTTDFGKNLYRQRCRIEHRFAQLTAFVGGLGPLPFWVRRFNRVKLWVHSKLLINAIRLLKLTHPPLAVE